MENGTLPSLDKWRAEFIRDGVHEGGMDIQFIGRWIEFAYTGEKYEFVDLDQPSRTVIAEFCGE